MKHILGHFDGLIWKKAEQPEQTNTHTQEKRERGDPQREKHTTTTHTVHTPSCTQQREFSLTEEERKDEGMN